MYRLFVAIDLPADIKSELSGMGFGVPGARWVSGDQMHLTIRFIGEVDGAVFRDLRDGLSKVNLSPFTYSLQGIGHFPPRGTLRVLWVGVNVTEGIIQLRSRVEAVIRLLKLNPDDRKFTPHITLARLKNTPKSRVANFIATNNLYKSREIKVGEFQLYSSVLSSKGASHRMEAEYDLIANKQPGD